MNETVLMLRGRRGLCSLLPSPLYAVISYLVIGYIHISSLSTCSPLIHLSLLISIPYHHYSIQSIHLEISPDPLLRAFPHLLALGLSPAPGRGMSERR